LELSIFFLLPVLVRVWGFPGGTLVKKKDRQFQMLIRMQRNGNS